MKRLLWLVSLACLLPIVTEMPSQAAGSLDIITKPSTGLAGSKANGFTDSANPFDNAESLTPALKVAESHSLSQPVVSNTKNPFAPVQLAGNPQNPVEKTATLATAPLQPAQANNNNNLLSQNDCNCGPNVPATPARPELERELRELNNRQFPSSTPGIQGLGVSPALGINNPVGFGADNGVGFLSGSYQSRTRGTQKSDGEATIGFGLFDANETVGLELSYSLNSFGTSQGFGSGGFNAKLHKRFGDAAVAVGWNRFANITFGNTGVQSDFPKNSYYAVATQVIRTTEDIDSFLSRIALSAGVGGGQFLSSDITSKDLNAGGVNAFGTAAFRVAKPVSAIVEWTGQDLAAGLSLTPFGDAFPLIITPAFRDITGVTGQGARFVLGVGTAFKF